MSMDLRRALTVALEDEYKARATYRKVLEAFGDVRPFVNIVESEERHIRALERLCDRYDVPVPRDEWPERVRAPASLLEACTTAVEAEKENSGLYEELREATRDYPDVQETFLRLQVASEENHLPAFERCAARESGAAGRGGGGGHGRRARHRGGR